MNKNNKICHPNLRRGLLASAVLTGLGMTPVQAFEIDTGNEDVSVRFDNTLKFNYAQRVEAPNSKLANSWNNNDGDRNFSSGSPVAQRVDVLSELDVVYKKQLGLRVSANSWYDHAYDDVGSFNPSTNQLNNGKPDSNHQSGYADRYYNGPSSEILDAFVFGSTEIGDQSLLSGKAGKHTLYWGESVLAFAHGNSYGQSGLDLSKALAVPGTEAKELFMPRNQLSASFTVNPELTLAAQYFLDWNASRLPESGTYLGFNDGLQNGGHNLSLVAARNPFFGTPGPLGVHQFLRLSNGHTYTPDNRGDFGLMAKWSPEWLDGTLGLYYRKTADTLPNVVLQPVAVGATQLASGNVGSYNQFYVDDIDVYGISLSKNIEGVSVGFDLNYRHNMPLASVAATVNPILGAAQAPGFISSFDGENGVARGNTLHAVLNGLATFAETPVWDGASLLVELGYSRWLDVTDNKQLFKGEHWYHGVDKVTKDNYVLGVNFNPVWYQVFPGIDMYLPATYNVGLAGQSSVQLGGNKGSGSYSVGVGMDVQNQYRFDLKYVDNFGDFDTCGTAGNASTHGDGAAPGANGQYNCVPGQTTAFAGTQPQLKDRGMVTLTFKTTL
ncbi:MULTISPECIES: DUF1302 domain-containing protein [unclassified Pseudomonas]|uniref:DUF1302 domain-containing protein n=1 Tax=unclassified Pseudomonas TaxID=196821 RepID=UPI000C87BE7C|nr:MULTISPECIES: DUF1302 domain-containing protein [unclassified Pseudomonas]PMU08650.1 DUF1302 domain-containing protein [Pseudomonas sp. FW305-20]PMU19428.1 DUF1302 domain-containing protein [Pseudomonas sp. FW305-122]PMU38543.1 DUF1302 domain-containing protein [Pseudomonas sp. FW305-47B]PMX59416.1 DUF1302 domain-containing protein [Pseudomonas sp. FW305-33]PMX69422.1 DUF1302 domain-containing protein [Pseudomonas sp. FW305-60]